ncbi:MAG: hypothetical protein E4H14_05530 [Candidatus Thorarchaeota archaeon]|nr:MAG: hypothetical protein E4H14_05530 [Candidatus Thorarchaeota archaeon]
MKLNEIGQRGGGLIKNQRLHDLIDQFQSATDPDGYADDSDYVDPDDIVAQIRAEFGDKIADTVNSGARKMHFGRSNKLKG